MRINLDIPLLIGLLLLSATGLFVLYSAGGERTSLIWSQMIRLLIAFTVMLIVAQISPDSFRRWSPAGYALGTFLLLLVLLFGFVGKGAQRWLDLGFIRFQPSEIMKIAVPMMLAWLFTRGSLPPKRSTLFLSACVLGIPAALILKQPDLGTALMILMSGAVIIFMAGLSWRSIAALSVAGALSAPLLWQFLHPYQQQRIKTLFDPWSDPLASGYHTIQSMIAIGSGGSQGKGWLEGSQSQLEFIPERHTDFVFAVFAEEFGYIGVILLLTLYLFITGRGLYIAYYTRDTYSRLLAASLSMTFFFYVFVNIGMVSGMLPVVGVPLPLVSFGGTSMVTILAGFGILMAIQGNRRLIGN